MQASGDEQAWPHPVRHVVIRAIGRQVGARFCLPRVAPFVPLTGRQRNTRVQHGGDAVDERDLRDHGPPLPRGHGEHRPLQQAAGGQAAGDDLVRGRPAVRGQGLRDRDEVGERVPLAVQPPIEPPPPAAFATAADVCDRVHVAAVQQAGHRQAEFRPRACLVSAVAIEQAGGGAIPAEPGPVGDRDRDERAVVRGCGDPYRSVPGRVVARYLLPLTQPPLAAGQVHVVPGRRADQRFGAHRDAGGLVLGVVGQCQRGVRAAGLGQPLRPGVPVEDPYLRRRPAPFGENQVPAERVAGHQAGVRRLRDDLAPAVGARCRDRGLHQPELDRAVVGDQVEIAAVQAVGVVGPVLDPRPPWLQHDRGRARVRRNRLRPKYEHGCGDTCGRKPDTAPSANRPAPTPVRPNHAPDDALSAYRPR